MGIEQRTRYYGELKEKGILQEFEVFNMMKFVKGLACTGDMASAVPTLCKDWEKEQECDKTCEELVHCEMDNVSNFGSEGVGCVCEDGTKIDTNGDPSGEVKGARFTATKVQSSPTDDPSTDDFHALF